MEGPNDVNQMTPEQQMEAMRMLQQQPNPQAQQPPGGMQMMQPDPGMMMASPGGPFFVGGHMQQHFMPPQQMGQPGVHPQNPKARLQCHACSKLLEYDAGAQYVQCFSCSTMNSVQQKTQIGGRVLSMLCAMCSTTNLAPYGINYVRCGTCHTISQVSHAYRVEMQNMMPGQMAAQPQRPYNPQEQMQSVMQLQDPQQMVGDVTGSQAHTAPHIGELPMPQDHNIMETKVAPQEDQQQKYNPTTSGPQQ